MSRLTRHRSRVTYVVNLDILSSSSNRSPGHPALDRLTRSPPAERRDVAQRRPAALRAPHWRHEDNFRWSFHWRSRPAPLLRSLTHPTAYSPRSAHRSPSTSLIRQTYPLPTSRFHVPHTSRTLVVGRSDPSSLSAPLIRHGLLRSKLLTLRPLRNEKQGREYGRTEAPLSYYFTAGPPCDELA